MSSEHRGVPEGHDGTSDATPGGYEGHRRPGELIFTLFLLLASAGLLWNAFGISGFEALSSPGALPMATTAVMVAAMLVILAETLRRPAAREESFSCDILPRVVLVFAALIVAYGVLLQPLGFLPTSVLFLIAAFKLLYRKGWVPTIGLALACLIGVWVVFRLVFTVLMPEGIVPEGDIIEFFRKLVTGGAS